MTEKVVKTIVFTPEQTTHEIYNIWCLRGEHPITTADIEEIVSHFLLLGAKEREESNVEQSNNYIRLAEIVTSLYHLGKCASKKFQRNFRLE